MKKIAKALTLVLALTMMAFCFISCGKKDEKVFALGFDCEYPPYGYLDTETNEYVGFDIEYAKLVCDKLGYELKLVPVNWDFKDTELESGNIDCIWSGFTIEGRENDYAWTVPYCDNSIVVLVADESGIKTLAGLAGKTVTVQKSSSGETALAQKEDLVASFKDGAYLTCADYTKAFMELESGAVDAIVIDIAVARNLMNGKTGYSILDEAITSETYGVGFRKTDTELCKKVSDAMEEIAKSGALDAIAQKYGIADQIVIGK